MEQTASFTQTQIPQPDRHAEAQRLVHGHAREQEQTPSEPRPITVIRAHSFSPIALFRGLSRLADYRDLLYTLSIHRLSVRYKQSILGPAWALLQPLSLMLIYTVIFSRIARVPSEGAPYALFAYCGLLPWLYFASALSTATGSLVAHFNLVTKVYFPREILPLTYVIAALADFLVGSTVLGGLMAYYQVSVTALAWYVIPIVAVLTVFATAVSLVLCAVQVRYRDIGVAMPLLLQLWMFASPVVYPLRVVPRAWQAAYELNPMVGIIESFRRVVVQGQPPAFHALMVSAIVSAVLLPIAFAYFKHVEATVADII
ncbi:MAG TPA: ABC transporter permease [Vicinamibacterales bacterium]|nr:ABC transporter permease [Vicinamibacterales bacterium]